MIKNKTKIIKLLCFSIALSTSLAFASPPKTVLADIWEEDTNDADYIDAIYERDYRDVSGDIRINNGNHEMTEGDQMDIGVSFSIYERTFHDNHVDWSSSNSDIASVSGDNRGATIYARNAGHVSICATLWADDIRLDRSWYEIDIKPKYVPLNGIGINPAIFNLDINQYKKLNVTYNPSDATNKTVYWSSENPIVANVTADGKVTGVSMGTTNIKCQSSEGGYLAIATVNVSRNVASVGAPTDKPAVLIDNKLLFDTTAAILNAAPNQIVTVAYDRPMAYDINVAAALAQRPDIQLITNFNYLGVTYSLSIPKGYDLSSLMVPAGSVDWLTISDQKNGPTVKILAPAK